MTDREAEGKQHGNQPQPEYRGKDEHCNVKAEVDPFQTNCALERRERLLIFLVRFSFLGVYGGRNELTIIYILGDDHRADYLGMAGHPVVNTPNLDALAADGVYVNNSFCTSLHVPE